MTQQTLSTIGIKKLSTNIPLFMPVSAGLTVLRAGMSIRKRNTRSASHGLKSVPSWGMINATQGLKSPSVALSLAKIDLGTDVRKTVIRMQQERMPSVFVAWERRPL